MPGANTASTSCINEAISWDSNPANVRSSELACQAILSHIPQLQQGDKRFDVVDIGCSTGRLSFMLAPYAYSLLGVERVKVMVEVFQAKLAAEPVHNLAVTHMSLDDPDFSGVKDAMKHLKRNIDGVESGETLRWDLIVSHLNLHVIPDLADVFRMMYHGVKPGGRIALTDFEDTGPEAALFHPANMRESVVRQGLKRDEMSEMLREAGFVDVAVETAFSLTKEVDAEESGGRSTLDFTFLICLGTKPAK